MNVDEVGLPVGFAYINFSLECIPPSKYNTERLQLILLTFRLAHQIIRQPCNGLCSTPWAIRVYYD
jgi:hypothetical protein